MEKIQYLLYEQEAMSSTPSETGTLVFYLFVLFSLLNFSFLKHLPKGSVCISNVCLFLIK